MEVRQCLLRSGFCCWGKVEGGRKEEEREEEGRRKEETLIKTGDAHLAGGEEHA